MSTGTPDATPSTPSTDGAKPAGGKPGGKYWAITAAIAVVLGVAGFFIGSAVKQADYEKGKSGYNKIYAEGNAAGQATGNAAGQAAGKATGEKLGTAQGLQKGKAAGEIIGKQEGQKAGEAAGYAKGYAAGIVKGASAALGGLSGWNTDTPYIVELNASPVTGVPYQVDTRTLMKANTSYFLCPNNPTTTLSLIHI